MVDRADQTIRGQTLKALVMTRQSGFTLLEVLVAFIVLALVGGMLLQLFQGGLRNIDSGKHITHAALLAQSKLTELQATTNLQEGEYRGAFDETYRWHISLNPYVEDADDEASSTELRGLTTTLDVIWDPDGRYRVKTLLLTQAEAP